MSVRVQPFAVMTAIRLGTNRGGRNHAAHAAGDFFGEAPGDQMAAEPARTPIRKPGEPELDDMHVASHVDGKVLSRSDWVIWLLFV